MLPHPFNNIEQEHWTVTTFAPDEVLFSQTERSVAMFYLVDGLVELQRHTKAGDKITIHQAKSGETFAEASLFSDQYHCDAVARKSSRVIEIPKCAVLQQFEKDGRFATEVAGRFARQVQSYRRRLELMAIRSAKDRVFAGVADGMLETNVIDFASQIGLTHEATYRALSVLVGERKLIKISRGRYQIRGTSR